MRSKIGARFRERQEGLFDADMKKRDHAGWLALQQECDYLFAELEKEHAEWEAVKAHIRAVTKLILDLEFKVRVAFV